MKSLMTFAGILAFNLTNFAMASDFSCPVSGNIANFTCSGTVKVKTLAELNAYRNDLGVVAKKPTVAKNLQIDFNPALTTDLVISTPCSIKVPTNIVMTSTANICLHGAKGISFDDNFNFTGKNLKLESKEEVIIEKNAVIKALDIKLLSIGSGETSKAFIREAANIEAANLSIESFNKGFVGKSSIVKLTGALGIYSLGDDEASVREGARVEATRIEISSTEETRIAKSTTLIANEIILNGVKCTINKTAIITADDRLGNCFLASTTNKAKFSISKNQGAIPLTVNFNGSSIADAKGFVWAFGDGETLNSLTPNVTHIYNRIGSFTATLKYATKENYKGLKSAGAIQIDVKATPISNPVVPVPPKGYFNYQADNTFVYLKAFIKKTTYDIANAYYVIDDNLNNKIQIPNFYPNALSSVEMNTYGRHKVTMHVVDVQGQTYSKSMNVFLEEDEDDIYPFVRLDADQSAPKTVFFDLSSSFIPSEGETLKDFKIDFGDGQTAVLTNATTINHTYAQVGTYLVRATAEFNGNEEGDELEIDVTNENTPILNPVAGFEYQIYDFAGNVVFTDDRSGTPNGEIISYVWDFGDGSIGYGKNASNFYAPGDYVVTLTVTDTAGMRSSQSQKITIIEEGDDIAAMLDCWSNGGKHLGCETVAFDKFNEIVRVKLEWGDGESENLINPDQASMGFSVREHNYLNDGTYNVKLTINTSRGQSKILSKDIEVKTVSKAPVANIFCYQDANRVQCDSLGSYTTEGMITNIHWSLGDGTEFYNQERIDHVYGSFGQYTITLTITNSLGETGSTTRVIPVRSAPLIVGKCESLDQVIKCDSIGTGDSDGSISSMKWKVYNLLANTEETYEGSELDYVIKAIGNYVIVLSVIDNEGNYSQKVFDNIYLLENQQPVASFNCNILNNKKLICDASLSTDDGTLVGYEWSFDGNHFVGVNQEFEVSDDGEYVISLKVKDNIGAENITEASYSLVPSMDNDLSAGTVKLLKNSNTPFYALNEIIQVKISNSVLAAELENNVIILNEKILTNEVINYDEGNNVLLIETSLLNGKNTLSLNLKDSDGKTIASELVLYAGERTVEFSTEDEDALVSKIKLIPLDDVDTGFSITLSNGRIDLNNVPSIDFQVQKYSTEFLGDDILRGESSFHTLKTNTNKSVFIGQNSNFSQGLLGWNIDTHNYSISNGKISLYPKKGESVSLHRIFKAGAAEKSMAFEYDLIARSKNCFYSIYVKNKTTGELSYSFSSVSYLDNNFGKTVKLREEVWVNSADDIIEFEVKLFDLNEEVVSSFFNINILSNAYADDLPGIEANVSDYTLDLIGVSNVKAYRLARDKLNKRIFLKFISVGAYPTYLDPVKNLIPYEYLTRFGVVPSNPIELDFRIKKSSLKKIQKAEIVLFSIDLNTKLGSTALSERDIKKLNESSSINHSAIFRFETMGISVQDIPEKIFARFDLKFEDGSVKTTVLENTFGEGLKSLVSMTGNNAYTYVNRFGTFRPSLVPKRDEKLGGDDWIIPSLFEFARDLVNPSSWVASESQSQNKPTNIQVNDISLMNGGFYPDHPSSHHIGTSIDLLMDNYIDNYDEIKKEATAKNLIYIFDNYQRSNYIKGIGVSYKRGSDFHKEIDRTCLKNGYMASDLIFNISNHSDHFHMNLVANPYSHIERTKINICHKFVNNRPVLYTCNGVKLDKSKYRIYAKKITQLQEVEDYVELAESNGDYNFEDFSNSVVSVRIVYNGDFTSKNESSSQYGIRAKGCGEEVITIDYRNEVQGKNYNCGNELGRTSYKIYPNGGIATLFKSLSSTITGREDSIDYSSDGQYEDSKSAICLGSKIGEITSIFNSKISNSTFDSGVAVSESEISGTNAIVINPFISNGYNIMIWRSKLLDDVHLQGVYISLAYIEARNTKVIESTVLGPMYLSTGNIRSHFNDSNIYNSFVSVNANVSNTTITNNSYVNNAGVEVASISNAFISSGYIGQVQDLLSGSYINKNCNYYPARMRDCSEDDWKDFGKECSCW